MPVSKKESAPWEEAGKKLSKASKKQPKSQPKTKPVESFDMTLQAFGTDTLMRFSSKREMEVAIRTISLRSARGVPTTIETDGKEFIVVPGLGIITSET